MPQGKERGPAPRPRPEGPRAPRGLGHSWGTAKPPTRWTGDVGGGGEEGAWEGRLGRREQSRDPRPGIRPARTPPPQPTAGLPSSCGCSQLPDSHIWQAARSLPVARAARREVKITLPPRPPVRRAPSAETPARRRARPSRRGDRSPRRPPPVPPTAPGGGAPAVAQIPGCARAWGADCIGKQGPEHGPPET